MKKVCLVILDGFGIGEDDSMYNATLYAKEIEEMKKKYQYYQASASGEYVGLPDGNVGNSEVGHVAIGAGRTEKHNLLRVNKAIKSGEFSSKIKTLKLTGKVHIIGLLSCGGVHSHIDHLKSLIECIPHDVYVHAIADGIDSPHQSFKKYIEEVPGIVSVGGRYFAMDRDNNKERTDEYYEMLVNNKVSSFDIDKIYHEGVHDEFIKPTLLKDCKISDDDTIFFFNIRADRMRQLITKLKHVKNIFTMTDYGIGVGTPLFPAYSIKNSLGEWLGKQGVEHVHLAETEKYAHVTYFFNGGMEEPFPHEERILVESSKLATFDLKPECSMQKVTDKALECIDKSKKFIVINLAGPDLLGHTGNLKAAIEAIKTTDNCVKQLLDACISKDYALVLTSDHGNSEMMHENGQVSKSHTNNKVPLIIANSGLDFVENSDVSLRDIAPTILDIIGVEIPKEMTGLSLVKK